MKATLNNRGKLAVVCIFILLIVAEIYPAGILIALAVSLTGYIFGYFVLLTQISTATAQLSVHFRHKIIYRSEIEILHIEIKNTGKNAIPFARLVVELPPSVYTVNMSPHQKFSIDPEKTLIFNFPVIPTARGTHNIGPITLLQNDIMRLFEIQLDSISTVNLKVYPKRLGDRTSKLKMNEVFTKLIKNFATSRKGLGNDFHGLREYIRGDPSKIVDWRATARQNKLISKEFEEEMEIDVYVVVQGGASMRGEKFDFSLGAATDLYTGIIKKNQPSGFLYFDDQMRITYKPSTSTQQRLRIWSEIFNQYPRDTYANYQLLTEYVRNKKITDTLFIIIGDLEGDNEKIIDALRGIRQKKNDVIFLDVWGFPFGNQQKLRNAIVDYAGTQYGILLQHAIAKSLHHDQLFDAIEFKKQLTRMGGIYGFFQSKQDDIIKVLDNALFKHFGRKWR